MVAFSPAACETTIFHALLDARRAHGGSKVILKDAGDGSALTYDRLILASFVFGRILNEQCSGGGPVGLMLPNIAGLVVACFGLNAFGRTIALLNYTAGQRNLASALKTGLIRQIVTSRRFIDKASLQELVDQLSIVEIAPGKRVGVIYLEDVRNGIGWPEKLKGYVSAKFARRMHSAHQAAPRQTGLLLFTSGTEGAPKGVALSNASIVVNARQIFAHAAGHLTAADSVLNPLPMFHSFGLTAGTLMPILNGMPVILYPVRCTIAKSQRSSANRSRPSCLRPTRSWRATPRQQSPATSPACDL